MKRVPLSTKDNTPHQKDPLRIIKIIYKQHPLNGESLELVDFVMGCRGEDPTVIVRLTNGRIVRLPLTYTDYIPQQTVSFDKVSLSPLHLLDIDGLRHIVKIINGIKQKENVVDNEQGYVPRS